MSSPPGASARQLVDTRYGTTGCRAYADFRNLLAATDIDAVVISTPDHWHVPISILAVQAGKDVMCEKPTYTISEGRALVDLVRKKQAVFQVGLEDRSVIPYHMLAEWVRNGAIGQEAAPDITRRRAAANPLSQRALNQSRNTPAPCERGAAAAPH